MSELEWLREFSINLRRMMWDARMTQRELADLSGLSESCISRYLNGTHAPSYKAIINLSYVFGCNTDDLIDFGSRIY